MGGNPCRRDSCQGFGKAKKNSLTRRGFLNISCSVHELTRCISFIHISYNQIGSSGKRRRGKKISDVHSVHGRHSARRIFRNKTTFRRYVRPLHSLVLRTR